MTSENTPAVMAPKEPSPSASAIVAGIQAGNAPYVDATTDAQKGPVVADEKETPIARYARAQKELQAAYEAVIASETKDEAIARLMGEGNKLATAFNALQWRCNALEIAMRVQASLVDQPRFEAAQQAPPQPPPDPKSK